MAELRLVLLLTALVVLVGIFIWTRYRARIPTITLPSLRREPTLPSDEATGGPRVPRPDPAKVVTIRLMCREKAGFPAEDLVLALREAGLRHGRYGIFHYGQDDGDDRPVFSVANLVEPGSFDLTRLHSDRYPGVSLFLALPGPSDGVVAFDAMVATARTLARKLAGELLDEQGSTLSIQRERYIREELIQFQHRKSLPG